MHALNKIWIALLVCILGLSQLQGQKINISPVVRMLALGDSYTIGQSVPESGRWPNLLMDELVERGASGKHPDYIATTGWTTDRLLQGIDANLDQGKDYNLVSILIGVNNQYQGLSIESYEPDLKRIIDIALETVKQDVSKVFILSIPDYAYTPFGKGNASISQEIDDYNRIKQRVAIEYGITYINITGISRQGLNDPSLVASDGLHPSELQYEKWVETILPYLKINTTISNAELHRSDADPLTISPNPLTSIMQIDASEELSRVRIMNAAGKMVHDQEVTSLPLQIDVSKLPPGIYTAIVDHAKRNEFSSHKIIIQRN